MNSNLLVYLLMAALTSFVVWLVIRSVVLWYFRINKIVALLEKIERNTRPAGTAGSLTMASDEQEYYSKDGIRVTGKRVFVQDKQWELRYIQEPVIKKVGNKYRVDLIDNRDGQHLHHFDSDSAERIQTLADAIHEAKQ